MRTKTTSLQSLGHILRSARKRKGLTQKVVGTSVGIDQATLSTIERGESNLRIDTLFRLLAALEMDMAISPRDTSYRQEEEGEGEGDNW